MTDERNTLTMEQQAERYRADLTRRVSVYRKVSDRDDWEQTTEAMRENLQTAAAGQSISVVVDVITYGGGPAGGVEFNCDVGDYGLELTGARTWHNDWYQPRGYADLDDDTANTLFDIWGIEHAMGER